MYSWDNAQVVLVGNKCDLEQDRAVSQDRGKRLADQLGNSSILSHCFFRGLKCHFLFVCFVLSMCCVVLFKGFTDKNTFMGKDSGDIDWK